MTTVSKDSTTVDPVLRISPKAFGRLSQFVYQELGIKMPESKISMLQSRLFRRVRELRLQSLDEYCEHLFSTEENDPERVRFVDAVTTNKTDFFREPQHFTQLTDKVLPELERKSDAGFRTPLAAWSAPCSSGEEPYSLAMVLSEYAQLKNGFRFKLLGTDISSRVLQAARRGIYTREQIEPVPAGLRRKYLLSGKGDSQGLVRIKPALRQQVAFHPLNFMDAEYPVRGLFDVIFCRNVLIYFDRSTQQAVIQKLCRKLQPNGFLFVSHSESLSGLDVPLESLGSSCFRKSA